MSGVCGVTDEDGKMLVFQAFSAIEESDDSDIDVEDILDISSSSSSSEDELVYTILVLSKKRGKLELRPRIQRYVENTIPRFSDQEFKSHFRMFPDTFEFILGLIGSAISKTNSVAGRKPISSQTQLLLTLWVMATQDSYRSICDRFNVGKATAIRSVQRVTYALYCLAPRFIQWPTGDRATQVIHEFEANSGFPGVLGAIDGTHIRINAPREDKNSYLNRKSYHSIQVQAVCTYDLSFTSVLAGYAGCVHDARVFRLSRVQEYIDNPEVYFPNDSHIIGDAAYGIHSNVMVPFKDNGHLTQRQTNFNFCLSSARMSIERAFGLWKGRWRRILDCLPMVKLEKIPQFLLATCVLHNICIQKHDHLQTERILRVTTRQRLTNNAKAEGDAKRIRIMHRLPMRAI